MSLFKCAPRDDELAHINLRIYEKGCGHRLTVRKGGCSNRGRGRWEVRGSGGSSLPHEFHLSSPKTKHPNKCEMKGSEPGKSTGFDWSLGNAYHINSPTSSPPTSPALSQIWFTHFQFNPPSPTSQTTTPSAKTAGRSWGDLRVGNVCVEEPESCQLGSDGETLTLMGELKELTLQPQEKEVRDRGKANCATRGRRGKGASFDTH